jgi:hypothetical protein
VPFGKAEPGSGIPSKTRAASDTVSSTPLTLRMD